MPLRPLPPPAPPSPAAMPCPLSTYPIEYGTAATSVTMPCELVTVFHLEPSPSAGHSVVTPTLRLAWGSADALAATPPPPGAGTWFHSWGQALAGGEGKGKGFGTRGGNGVETRRWPPQEVAWAFPQTMATASAPATMACVRVEQHPTRAAYDTLQTRVAWHVARVRHATHLSM